MVPAGSMNGASPASSSEFDASALALCLLSARCAAVIHSDKKPRSVVNNNNINNNNNNTERNCNNMNR
jgi:hypothetical protein